jgi:hypothetical protein
MTLSIYKDCCYDFEHVRTVRYTLFVDEQYLMYYVIESLSDKNEKEIILMLRRKVLTQPYLNKLLNPNKYKYMPQGELVHEEKGTEIIKELKAKLKIKRIEEDF